MRGIPKCFQHDFKSENFDKGKYNWSESRFYDKMREFIDKHLAKHVPNATEYEFAAICVLVYPKKSELLYIQN